jgi:Overcoming lysogenization defect protein-like, TOPRIM domain
VTRAVILVEGTSDKVAVETLAEMRGRDLQAEGVVVVPIGGAQAIRRVAEDFGSGVTLTGLCDVGEAESFRRVLGDGFYVCSRDLEDELIRALGPDTVEEIVDAHGDLGPFRTLQKQSQWQGRPKGDQLRRFMGSGGRRKIRYARFLVEALEPEQVPAPLAGVLAHV